MNLTFKLIQIMATITIIAALFADSCCASDLKLSPHSNLEIENLLSRAISGKRGSLVVGLTDGRSHRIYGRGKVSNKLNTAPTGQTVYELGSVTKIFTSIVLRDLCKQGRLSLNEPASKYLPKNITIPSYKDKQITLFHLATHHSGLARDPDDFKLDSIYSKPAFHSYLARSKLVHAPGSDYLYSNCGYRLLGEIIEYVTNAPYETLLKERIFQPLKLKHTMIVLSQEDLEQLADGHSEEGKVMRSSPQTGGASGGLKSCADDLLVLLDTCLINSQSTISKNIQDTLKYRKTISADLSQCLAWVYTKHCDTYNKSGQIDGYSTCIGFSPRQGYGIVVLSSTLQIESEPLFFKCLEILRKAPKHPRYHHPG